MCFSKKYFATDRRKTVRHLTLLQVSGENQPVPAEEPVPGNKVLIPVQWEITKWRDVKTTLTANTEMRTTEAQDSWGWKALLEIIQSKALAQNQGQLTTLPRIT